MALGVSPFGTSWLITAYNQQVNHFFLSYGAHWKKDSTRARDSSSSRFSGLRSVSGAGSCVCACSCLPLSHQVTSPLFPQWALEVRASFSLARGRFSVDVCGPRWGRGAGTEHKARLQTKRVTPKSSQGTVREWSAELLILTWCT